MWIQSWEKTIKNVWQMKAREQQEDDLQLFLKDSQIASTLVGVHPSYSASILDLIQKTNWSCNPTAPQL